MTPWRALPPRRSTSPLPPARRRSSSLLPATTAIFPAPPVPHFLSTAASSAQPVCKSTSTARRPRSTPLCRTSTASSPAPSRPTRRLPRLAASLRAPRITPYGTSGGPAAAAALVEIDLGGVPFTVTGDATRAFSLAVRPAQQSAFAVARVRVHGADGTYSPSVDVPLQI